MAIFGLNNLNSLVRLSNNKLVSRRSLLKSIPGIPGMSRPRLFLTVISNATQTCAHVTFQQCDRPFIEQLKPQLPSILKNTLLSGQDHILYSDPDEGVHFLRCLPQKRESHKNTLSFSRAFSLSPTSEPIISFPSQKTPQSEVKRAPPQAISYKGVLQSQTAHTQSVEVATQGMTTATTTQTSQTIMAIVL
jgi:hypothetical protein